MNPTAISSGPASSPTALPVYAASTRSWRSGLDDVLCLTLPNTSSLRSRTKGKLTAYDLITAYQATSYGIRFAFLIPVYPGLI